MKFILGSGIVALLAREILGPEWTIIPFYKSRFFSFNPSLDDNFIIRNKEIDDYVKDKLGQVNSFPYRRAYSIKGMLYDKHDDGIATDWAYKTFGASAPTHINAYMKHNMNFDVYDIRTNELYAQLLEKYKAEINKGIELGNLKGILNKTLIFDKQRVDYDHVVNTLPLNALLNIMGLEHNLVAKPVHFMHVYTEHLDFEGNNQTLVVDNVFPFYKVSNIARNRYLFYLKEDIENPGPFFMSFLKDFDILDGTSISDYLVLGDLPRLDILEHLDIMCVGSYAQWDYCMDIGSCILRLLRYAQRDFSAKKPIITL